MEGLGGETTINGEMILKGTPDRFLNSGVLLGATLIGIAVSSHLQGKLNILISLNYDLCHTMRSN